MNDESYIEQRISEAKEFARKGEWEKALQFDLALAKSLPGDYETFNRLGKAYAELGLLEKARESYIKSLTLKQNNEIAQQNLKIVSGALRTGKSVKAIEGEITLESKRRHIEATLEQNKIDRLYHFTDKSNLGSIKQNGGLFSWYHLKKLGIRIPCAGGDELSRRLDTRKHLENYVHLCLNPDQPMLYVLKRKGHIKEPVILEIDKQVIHRTGTLFSDKNATASTAIIGGTSDDFDRIRFFFINSRWLNDDEKGYFQAEVLIRECVPLEFIKIKSIGYGY